MKVQHWPYSLEDGPVVYPADALTFDSRLRADSVPLGSSHHGKEKGKKYQFVIEK